MSTLAAGTGVGGKGGIGTKKCQPTGDSEKSMMMFTGQRTSSASLLPGRPGVLEPEPEAAFDT